MNVTYTWVLGRKILLLFLISTIIFSIITFVVRNTIIKNLTDVSELANSVERDHSKPEQAMLLLHQAEDDFQEALLNTDNKKVFNFKVKLTKAFDQIDTLLKEKADTARLSPSQINQLKFWYRKKIFLSDKLYILRHSFDSLLNVYAGFHNAAMPDIKILKNVGNESTKTYTDTIKKAVEKKGFFRRIKDAISNKNDGSVIVVNHNTSMKTADLNTQQIASANRNAYLQKLHQLQQKNVNLLNLQRELIMLNTKVSNQMESIINDVEKINHNMSEEFKNAALKKYQSATILLNRFYLAELFLVMAFAVSLIIFIVQLERSEILLRKENEKAIITAQQQIDELIKKNVMNDDIHLKKEKLEEIIQLAVNNNPAFLMKFNEFDPGFIKILLRKAPALIATEIEFCVLLRLNFETKEIARYTKTSVRSVEGKKYRIRKKLCIPTDQDINIWMTNI